MNPIESNKENSIFPKKIIDQDASDVLKDVETILKKNLLKAENFNQNLNKIESKNESTKNQTNESQVIEIEKKIPNLRIDVNRSISKIDSKQFIIRSYNAPKLAKWHLGELNVLLNIDSLDFKSDPAVKLNFVSSNLIAIETKGSKKLITGHINEELKALIELEQAGFILFEQKFKEMYFKTHTILELKVLIKPEFFKKSEEIYSLKDKKFLKLDNFESQVTLPQNLKAFLKLKMLKTLGLEFDNSSLFQIKDFIEANDWLEEVLKPIKKSSIKETNYDDRSLNKQYLNKSENCCQEIQNNPMKLLNYEIESLNFVLRAEGKNLGEKIENGRILPTLAIKEGNKVYFNFLDDTFACDSSSFELKGGILANSEELDSFRIILRLLLVNANEFSEPQANFSNLVIKTEEELNDPLKKIQKNKRNSTNILELELESQTEEKFSCTSLIITSNSGLEDWRQILEESCQILDKRVFIYCKTKILLSNLYEKDLVLISYEDIFQELSKFDSKFSRHPFWRIILDKAHYIKSIPTNNFEKLLQLRGNFRWCVTPYPIKSDETELAFYFKFLRIKYLNDTRFLEKLKAKNKIVDLMQNFMLRLTPHTPIVPETFPISHPKIIYKETRVRLSEDAMSLYRLIEERPELFISFLFSSSTIDVIKPSNLEYTLVRKFCNSPLIIFNRNSFVEQETTKEKLISSLELFSNRNIDGIFARKLLDQIRDEDFEDCTVCMQKPCSVYIFNCGHYLCNLCYVKWSKCPNKCPNLNHSPTWIYNRPYYKHILDINFKLAKDGYTKINQIVAYLEELILQPDARIKVVSSCEQTLKLIQTNLWKQHITSDFFNSHSITRTESANKVELCMKTNLMLNSCITHIVNVDLFGEDFESLNQSLIHSQLQNSRSIIVRSFICSGTIEEKLYSQNDDKYKINFNPLYL